MDLRELLAQRTLVADGAMGTELMRLGAPGNIAGELLNIEMPEIVEKVHRAYVQAGSDIIITNTFGASPIKLESYQASERCDEINAAAVKVARKAAGEKVLVAGDIGPSGQMLKPYGPAEPENVLDNFTWQANALADTGVDVIILETYFDLAEAMLALKAAVGTGLQVIASMTFNVGPKGVVTMMGNTAADCGKALEKGGATVIGANCTVTADSMIEVGRALSDACSVPIMLQPNAGQPEVVGDKTIYRETPEQFAAYSKELVENGASIIGGCCGTDPRFIAAVRNILDQ